MELADTHRVELIARTEIRWDKLQEVLAERGLKWRHDTGEGPIRGGRWLGSPREGGRVALVQGSNAALLAEYAGRGCYNSFDGDSGAGMGRKTNREYVEHILEVGHGSVLEHATFTFQVWGNSRGFTHELVRHRVGTAFSQASTRFRNEAEDGRFVIPPLFRGDEEAEAILAQAAANSLDAYDKLRACARRLLKDVDIDKTAKIKTARGAARSVLPIGLESPIVVTMNIRTLRHFLEQRASRYAELEIREIAVAIWRIMLVEEPVLFGDYRVVVLTDSTEALESAQTRKV